MTDELILRSERSFWKSGHAIFFGISLMLILLGVEVDALTVNGHPLLNEAVIFLLIFAPAFFACAFIAGPGGLDVYFYTDRIELIRRFRGKKILQYENLTGYCPIEESQQEGPDLPTGMEIFEGRNLFRVRHLTYKNAEAINNFLASKGVVKRKSGVHSIDQLANQLFIVAGLILLWLACSFLLHV